MAIADLGCGTGLCGRLIRDLAGSLVGCDLSAGMLEKAKRRQTYDALHHQELAAYLLDHDATFDALVCADTLCYFGELDQVASSAASALRPDGVFVFTVEALPDDTTEHYHLQPHGRYAHQRDYVVQALRKFGLMPTAVQHEVLRFEAGQPVHGWLVGAIRE